MKVFLLVLPRGYWQYPVSAASPASLLSQWYLSYSSI
jgi:hypothetical protein